MSLLRELIERIYSSIMRHTWQRVANSPLNSSKTKMLFSFPKSKRFSSNDSRPSSSSSCDKFYQLPPLIGRSSPKAAIGYGRKVEMARKHALDFPPPNKYSIKSIFDDCKKGYAFRLGRDKMKKSGIFQTSFTPGPGAYNTFSRNQSPSITLKPKLREIHDSSFANPGPGSYNIPKFMSETGKFNLSTIRNVSTPTFKDTLHKRSDSSYEMKENMSPNGTYYNSRFHNSGTRTFGKVKRTMYPQARFPNVGPGSYETDTEFGAKDRA